MAMSLRNAKVVELATEIDPHPMMTLGGAVLWATVRIGYIADGLGPEVNIRVPVEVRDPADAGHYQGEALRLARQLIQHACINIATDLDMADTPVSILEGLTQELGITQPTTATAATDR